MKTIRKICQLGLYISLCAATGPITAGPWMTGPLLAPSGHTIPKGHVNYEPYLFYTDSFGLYNSHGRVIKVPDTRTLNVNPLVGIGLTDYLDIQLSIPYYFNNRQNQRANNISDVAISMGIQVLKQKDEGMIPSLKLSIQETLPTGNFRYLNPAKRGVDAFGAGSYQTTVSFNFQLLKEIIKNHYLNSRLSLATTYPKKVNVKGFNAYGGGNGTSGNLSPGQQYSADLGFEFQLTQHWVAALDVLYLNRKASSFSGTAGTTLTGGPANIGHGRVNQWSVAPAIEYNVNEKLGIIAGYWRSTRGRNANDFWSYVLAVNYYV